MEALARGVAYRATALRLQSRGSGADFVARVEDSFAVPRNRLPAEHRPIATKDTRPERRRSLPLLDSSHRFPTYIAANFTLNVLFEKSCRRTCPAEGVPLELAFGDGSGSLSSSLRKRSGPRAP